MNPRPLRHFALATLATAALLGALPAQAVGRLTDINVIDRDSGETLPVYTHKGDHWVAGRPGARYAVSVRNATRGRVMSVVSVDGVNVVSGETASLDQTGYVLSPWQQYDITGWRKSDSEVAAFHFTASPASYAARTGRPDHVGVIGVAVFREKVAPPVLAPQHEPHSITQRRERWANADAAPTMKSQAESASAEPPPAASPAQGANDSAAPRESMAARRMAPASPAPRLGTGHGERESAWVGQTTFERRSDQPDDLIRIRYDSRDNLIAMGIIPTTVVPPRPNPFPVPTYPRYAPDPN